MQRGRIEKSRRVVIATIIILLLVGIFEAFMTSNEFGLPDFVIKYSLIPIIIFSIMMSAYWILLTDDFWYIYEKSDLTTWTITRTILKFLVWIPAMGLLFFAAIQGGVSIYNRTAGEQNPTLITGQIIDKDKFKSSGTTRYYFKLNELKLKRNIELKVDEIEYDKYEIGENYQTERKVGALGFIYETK